MSRDDERAPPYRLTGFGHLAKEHWEKFCPNLVATLKEEGEYEKALRGPDISRVRGFRAPAGRSTVPGDLPHPARSSPGGQTIRGLGLPYHPRLSRRC